MATKAEQTRAGDAEKGPNPEHAKHAPSDAARTKLARASRVRGKQPATKIG